MYTVYLGNYFRNISGVRVSETGKRGVNRGYWREQVTAVGQQRPIPIVTSGRLYTIEISKLQLWGQIWHSTCFSPPWSQGHYSRSLPLRPSFKVLLCPCLSLCSQHLPHQTMAAQVLHWLPLSHWGLPCWQLLGT